MENYRCVPLWFPTTAVGWLSRQSRPYVKETPRHSPYLTPNLCPPLPYSTQKEVLGTTSDRMTAVSFSDRFMHQCVRCRWEPTAMRPNVRQCLFSHFLPPDALHTAARLLWSQKFLAGCRNRAVLILDHVLDPCPICGNPHWDHNLSPSPGSFIPLLAGHWAPGL